MADPANASAAPRPPQRNSWKRILTGAIIALLGIAAMASPLLGSQAAFTVLGGLLLVGGILEAYQTFDTENEQARRLTYLGGTLSVLAGLLLLAGSSLVLHALTFLLAASFGIDGVSKVVTALLWPAADKSRMGHLAAGLFNLLLCVLLAIQWPVSGLVAVAIWVGLRMAATGWYLIVTPVRSTPEGPSPLVAGLHPDRRLRLRSHPELAKIRATLDAEDEARRRIDAYWCSTFVLTFFAIHVGRMDADWTLVGLLSPGVAVLGDLATALLLAFGVILPGRLAWRALTRPMERRVWERMLGMADRGESPGWRSRWIRPWLVYRLRFAETLRRGHASPRAALRWGLQLGLPPTAILIALNPIWGFSWYFNSENWATEIWVRYAERRTDDWREKMIDAVQQHYGERGMADERLFQVAPDGVAGAADFSFLVIGDPGEGDGSQHCLRDQYLLLGQRPEVKFLVVASDVIYPAGAMKDYEAKFYLPFKGFTKPVYAVPGNHDWYDALEGFAANFLEPDAARAAIRARVDADLGLTTTNEARISHWIQEAARLRQEYGVRTGGQRGPYFELQTDRFALLVVDTGVSRKVDPGQMTWLKAALNRARGKWTLALLGHPLYAGGQYQAVAGEKFAELHQLLREHEVAVVMAGDTHDLEYYREKYPTETGTRFMHHFVNGGGGAYLSAGTALAWPKQPPTTDRVSDCACYPSTNAVTTKLDSQTPGWKTPIWWWVKYLGGWPSSAEGMASAFDFNSAPFFQSFIEVRVEGSANQVRLLPYGANGRLRWRELETLGEVRPAEQSADDMVEFRYPLPAAKASRQ